MKHGGEAADHQRADGRVVAEAKHLLVGSEEAGSFAVRYAEAREREAAVAAAHAEIEKSFG